MNPLFAENWWAPEKWLARGPSQSCTRIPHFSRPPSLERCEAPCILPPLCNWFIMQVVPLSLVQLSHDPCHLQHPLNSHKFTCPLHWEAHGTGHSNGTLHINFARNWSSQWAGHESETTGHPSTSLCPACPLTDVWGDPGAKENQSLHGAVAQPALHPATPAGSLQRHHTWNETRKSQSSQKFPWESSHASAQFWPHKSRTDENV